MHCPRDLAPHDLGHAAWWEQNPTNPQRKRSEKLNDRGFANLARTIEGIDINGTATLAEGTLIILLEHPADAEPRCVRVDGGPFFRPPPSTV